MHDVQAATAALAMLSEQGKRAALQQQHNSKTAGDITAVSPTSSNDLLMLVLVQSCIGVSCSSLYCGAQ
jgi:hypothetical protein